MFFFFFFCCRHAAHGDSVCRRQTLPKVTGRPGSLGRLSLLPLELGSGGVSWLGTNSSLRLNAQRRPIRRSSWASLGQSGRTAAIYRELRAIDMHTAERQWRTVPTARRHVREGEQRVARQESTSDGNGDDEGKKSPQGRKSLEMIRGSLTLAKYHLRELEDDLPAPRS